MRMDEPIRINTAGNEVHPTGLAFCRGAGMPSAAFTTPEDVAAISGAAFAVRRDVWEALGGMDETFFLYVEDTDLSWRAWLAGYRCRYVPEPVVYHEYNLRFGAGKFFFQERNRYLLLLKNLRWRTLLLLLPSLLLAEVVTWGFLLMYDPRRWREKVQAYLWLLRHGREVRARRREVQTRRRARDRDLLARCTPYLAYEYSMAGRHSRRSETSVWRKMNLALRKFLGRTPALGGGDRRCRTIQHPVAPQTDHQAGAQAADPPEKAGVAVFSVRCDNIQRFGTLCPQCRQRLNLFCTDFLGCLCAGNASHIQRQRPA